VLTYRSGVADDGLDRLLSADSHVVEPPDLFVTGVPRSALARAPRLVDDGAYQRWEFLGSELTVRLGLVGSAGKEAADVNVDAQFSDLHCAAYDPDARLLAQDRDDVVPRSSTRRSV
jgi:hypothetical protein